MTKQKQDNKTVNIKLLSLSCKIKEIVGDYENRLVGRNNYEITSKIFRNTLYNS